MRGWVAALCPSSSLNTHTCNPKSDQKLGTISCCFLPARVMGENHTNITCTLVSPEVVECDGKEFHQKVYVTASEALFWIYLGVYIILVLFAGEESLTG